MGTLGIDACSCSCSRSSSSSCCCCFGKGFTRWVCKSTEHHRCCSCPHTPALAILCPLEEWCDNSAMAIATVIRSCRNMERSRRSLRRRATPLDSGLSHESRSTVQKKSTRNLSEPVVIVVVLDAIFSRDVFSTSHWY